MATSKNKPAAPAPKSAPAATPEVETKTAATTEVETTTAVVAEKPKKVMPYKKLTQFQLPDGSIVNTQKEATEFARRHLVVEALLKVSEGNQETADWLLANKTEIMAAYSAAEVKREISDETREKMRKALLERRAAGKL